VGGRQLLGDGTDRLGRQETVDGDTTSAERVLQLAKKLGQPEGVHTKLSKRRIDVCDLGASRNGGHCTAYNANHAVERARCCRTLRNFQPRHGQGGRLRFSNERDLGLRSAERELSAWSHRISDDERRRSIPRWHGAGHTHRGGADRLGLHQALYRETTSPARFLEEAKQLGHAERIHAEIGKRRIQVDRPNRTCHCSHCTNQTCCSTGHCVTNLLLLMNLAGGWSLLTCYGRAARKILCG